jgi:hypothetical protein
MNAVPNLDNVGDEYPIETMSCMTTEKWSRDHLGMRINSRVYLQSNSHLSWRGNALISGALYPSKSRLINKHIVKPLVSIN